MNDFIAGMIVGFVLGIPFCFAIYYVVSFNVKIVQTMNEEDDNVHTETIPD